MRKMKDNLAEYVRREGNVPFARRSLNAVDAAIFTQLAYLDYSLVPNDMTPTLAALAKTELLPLMTRGIWMSEANDELLAALVQSVRFRDVHWQNAVNTSDPDAELQFAAITFELTPGEYFVAYRGTQATLLDWKEDFNMTYMDAVPSQKLAVRYLEHRMADFAGQYFIGGHSKGGNLAVYALMHSSRAMQAQVQLAFNFDGPGFKEPVPVHIAAKVRKFVPESTIIGLLLEPAHEYTIVQSNATGINQHNLLTWRVQRRHFAVAEKLKWSARYTQRAIDAWLQELPPASRQEVLDSLFAVLNASDIDDLNAIGDAFPETAKTVLAQVRATDPEVRKQWQAAFGDLMSALRVAALRADAPQKLAATARNRRAAIIEQINKVTGREADKKQPAPKTALPAPKKTQN
jgi:hypothetical protein